MSLTEAAASGDRIAALRELRDILARQIETIDNGRDLAALSRQLTLVLSELAELVPNEEADAVDEIAARRNSRRSSPSTSSPRSKRSS